MSPETKMVADDLRRSCIYGYAHQVVAHQFGVGGFIHIVKNVNGGALEKHYTGEFTARAQLQGQIARLVGLAGPVAACYDEDPNVSAPEIEERISFDLFNLSATDAPAIEASDERDVEQCLLIIRQQWDDIVRNARIHTARLMRPARQQAV